jgi:predicted dehydrogenase
MTTPLRIRVGLVGAGPWAKVFTGPMLAASQHVDLVGIWARRGDASAELAANLETRAIGGLDELFGSCDAVAFAVPPSVQADIAAQAAAAGKPVLLDKPTGRTLAEAQSLADAVGKAGVVSQVILTNRYLPMMRTYLSNLDGFAAHGGRALFLGAGSLPGNYFGTPWRLSDGGLLDLAPHAFDSLDASLGPIVEVVSAFGDPLGTTVVTLRHEGGQVSSVAMSGTTTSDRSGLVVEVFGRKGHHVMDTAVLDDAERTAQWGAAMVNIPAEFAEAVRTGVDHPLNAAHGLRLQAHIERATNLLENAASA